MDSVTILDAALTALALAIAVTAVLGLRRWRRRAIGARQLLIAAFAFLTPTTLVGVYQAQVAARMPDLEEFGDTVTRMVLPTTSTIPK